MTVTTPEGFILMPVKISHETRKKVAQKMHVRSLENVLRWYEAFVAAVEESRS